MVSLGRVMGLVVMAAWTAPAFAATDERVVVESAIAQSSSGGQPATRAEVQQLQVREQQDQQLEQFDGGDDGIYIGSGVLLLALIILVIVLLVR